MMYVVFKEEVTENGTIQTTFMLPYVEEPYTLRVKDLVNEMNELVPQLYRERTKVRALRAGDYDLDFTREDENIFIVARTRKNVVEEILDAYTEDMTSAVSLLNKEVKEDGVKYIGSWIRGSLA